MPVCQEEVIAANPMDAQVLDHCKSSLAVQVLTDSGALQLRVTGSSMLPTIWPGDFLTIRSASVHQAQIGDVVFCRKRGQFVVHRVVRKLASGLITRGDSMPSDDSGTPGHNVLGLVTEVRRNGATIVIPNQLSIVHWLSGRILARCDLLLRLVLRWHTSRGKQICDFPVPALNPSPADPLRVIAAEKSGTRR